MGKFTNTLPQYFEIYHPIKYKDWKKKGFSTIRELEVSFNVEGILPYIVEPKKVIE